MQQEQTKTIIVNILTALVVIVFVVVAYFVFIRKEVPIISSVVSSVQTVAQVAEETALIGSEIDTTVSDLGDLAAAVESSNVIFELPAFKNLKDFSIVVSEEPVGRTNPFVPTVWKINMENLTTGAGTSLSSSVDSGTAVSLPVSSPSSGI